jgi:hypothetical protein
MKTPDAASIQDSMADRQDGVAASGRDFLTDVRMRASNDLTEEFCSRWDRDDPERPDPADVHEDIREALWPFFEEIRKRMEAS